MSNTPPDDRDHLREYGGHLIVPVGTIEYAVAERCATGWHLSVFQFPSIAEAERFIDIGVVAYFFAPEDSDDDTHDTWLADNAGEE